MTDYVKLTNFATKDALASGNPLKVVSGTEINAEFDAIATAVATKFDSTDLGVTVQAYDAQLADIAGLTPTDNGVVVGNGTNFVVESGATLRTSIGAASSGANADITSMTALTAPTVAANPMRAADIQAQLATAFTTGGTGTAFTLTPTPAIAAYAANQEWDVVFSAACGAAPTFQVSGLASPPNLVKQNADGTYSNLAAGDFPSGWTSKVKMVNTTQALVRSLPGDAAVEGAFKNLKASATGTNATVTASADEIIASDSSNNYKTLRNVSLSINSAASGANGLDTGALATSTWYALWVIHNPTTSTTAGLLSISATAPTLPTGYTMKARVGWIRTDGTANKYPLAFKLDGESVTYAPASGSNVTDWPLMASGTSVTVWTAVAVGAFVPPTAKKIRISFYTGNLGSGHSFSASPVNTGTALQYGNNGNAGGIGQRHIGDLPLLSTNIYWGGTAAGAAEIRCIGWEDNL